VQDAVAVTLECSPVIWLSVKECTPFTVFAAHAIYCKASVFDFLEILSGKHDQLSFK
jgi:hypothetical protein